MGQRRPPWKGLNKPHRADRRWSLAWSPEAIYQSLYIEGRGALKRELVTCLRTGRALRQPRERSRNKPQGHVTEDVVLSKRPSEADDRAVAGNWEGDLIIGTGRSAIGALVERSSRSTILVHLPRLEGWGEQPVVKNAPALGGYGALAMNAALATSLSALPLQLRQTLTWDRGKSSPGTRSSPSILARECSSPTPTRPGSARQTRTQTGCCGSTSRKEPTCLDGRPRNSEQLLSRSTTGPGKLSAGVRPRKYLPSSYDYFNRPVLHRPVELTQYTSTGF